MGGPPPRTTTPAPSPGGAGAAPEPLSRRNARVVRLGRLSRHRRDRAREGRVVLDGPTLVVEALAAGVEVEEVFVEPDALERADVADAVAAAAAAGARTASVAGGLRGIVDPATPNGLAAVARTPEPAAPAGAAAGPALHLVLVGVADPGNVGTVLRTAEAAGAMSVVLTDGSVDPWSPKVVRASAGSVLRVPVRQGSAAAVLGELGERGVLRVGTAGSGGEAPEDLDLTGPVAVVLGSEAHGLPADAPVDAWATLPMRGAVESLNVAVAGAVLAYEVGRQRRAAGVERA